MSAKSVVPDAPALLAQLREAYPGATCALHHRSPFELLVATILSAQCTDERVNRVTPALFARYPTPSALARATQEDLEGLVRSTGFFRNKAKNLIAMSQQLVERHHGEVPNALAELVELAGVARKTANVVTGTAFGMATGIVVDTHVTRLSQLLGLTRERDPEKIERDLMQRFDRTAWIELSHLLILHGRRVCIARRPRCGECTLASLCPSAGSVSSAAARTTPRRSSSSAPKPRRAPGSPTAPRARRPS
ncbi:MAG: endonuclease III [Myxococcota bacterium]